jgi:hypothetical protein
VVSLATRRIGYWRRVTIVLVVADVAILAALGYTLVQRFG